MSDAAAGGATTLFAERLPLFAHEVKVRHSHKRMKLSQRLMHVIVLMTCTCWLADQPSANIVCLS